MKYISIAVVNDIYTGTPHETVRISTGGNSEGIKLKRGSQWLIISRSSDDLRYFAGLESQSLPLTEDDELCQTYYPRTLYGRDYLPIIRQFLQVKKTRYTGSKDIYLKHFLIAKGTFKDGRAHGKWEHYFRTQSESETPRIALENEYNQGRETGIRRRYRLTDNERSLESEKHYRDGKLTYNLEYNKKHKIEYPTDNTAILYQIDDKNDTIALTSRTSHQSIATDGLYLHYKHGLYYNLVDSSKYTTLGKGHYYKGARVGDWEFYNRQGSTVRREHYAYPDTLGFEKFVICNPDGTTKVIGTLIDNIPIGHWKSYYDGKLELEYYISDDPQSYIKIRHFSSGGRRMTPYVKNLINGAVYTFSAENTLESITHYRNGIKHGSHIRYTKTGDVAYTSTFQHGIETTLLQTDGKAPIIDGFQHGYHVQVNSRTGNKTYEGEYWMGYQVGKHINYYKDGNYTISYYETDRDKILNSCTLLRLQTQQYSKDGVLIRESDY